MTGQEVGIILGALVPIIVAIGTAFGWLIREIVKNSRDAVTELQKTLRQTQEERDLWRDRAYASGWRPDQ